MSKYPNLPLIAAKGIEPLSSWENIKAPSDLLRYLISNLSVDPNQLLVFQEIAHSSTEPSGDQRGQLWIKTDGYPAIGIFIGDSYRMIAEYPFNVPLLWTKASSLFPSYLSKLTDSELTAFGLENPEGYFYFMLKA